MLHQFLSPQRGQRWPVSSSPCRHRTLAIIVSFTELIGKRYSISGSRNLHFSHSEWGWLSFPVFKSHFYFFCCGKNFLFLAHFSLGLLPSCLLAGFMYLDNYFVVCNICSKYFCPIWGFYFTLWGFYFAPWNFKNVYVVKFNQIHQSFYLCLRRSIIL